MKFPIVIKPEYTLYLEHWNGVYWFHTDVNLWNARVKRMMIEDLRKICDLVTMQLRAFVKAENLKLQKFAVLIGFLKEFEATLEDGSNAFVYRLG